MMKVDMLKVLSAVAVLTLSPVMDAALLVPGDPDVFEEPADGDVQKVASQDTEILEKLLRSRSMTTFPDGDENTEAMRAKQIKATSSPNVRNKTFSNPLKRVSAHSDRQEEISLAAKDLDGSLRTDLTTSSSGSLQQTEKNLFRLSEVTNSNEQDHIPKESEKSKLDPVSGGHELVKMLSAFEEFHKLMKNTLSSRITIIPRGNSNGRNPGKKNRLTVTEGNLKSTTVSTAVRGSTPLKSSTQHTEPNLNEKDLKKSLQSAPKKPNKRVCFWKYCSQN